MSLVDERAIMMEKSSSIAQDKTKRIIIIADQEMWEL
jgi:hypothetical protein